MADALHLSRRERQIMEILFARSEATVTQVTHELPDPPTPMAVRRLLHILVEKGHVKRRLRVMQWPRTTATVPLRSFELACNERRRVGSVCF